MREKIWYLSGIPITAPMQRTLNIGEKAAKSSYLSLFLENLPRARGLTDRFHAVPGIACESPPCAGVNVVGGYGVMVGTGISPEHGGCRVLSPQKLRQKWYLLRARGLTVL